MPIEAYLTDNLQNVISLCLQSGRKVNSLTCPDAQRGYQHAIDEFVGWYCSQPRLASNKTVALCCLAHLEFRKPAPGTINLRLGAVRRLAYEAADFSVRIWRSAFAESRA